MLKDRVVLGIVFVICFSMLSPAAATTFQPYDEGKKTTSEGEDLQALGDTPWPAYGQNPQHTGLSPYSCDHVDGSLKWSLETQGKVTSSPCISGHGTIYFGSNDDKLYAVYPNGTKKWSFPTGDDIYSSPVIADDGTIYVGSRDNKLYAVNSSGSLKWSFSTAGSVESSPIIGSDGTIYLGSWDGSLYALNPDGTKRWNFTTNGSITSSPAIDNNGNIYFGSRDGKLYALNQDGSERWNFSAGGKIDSSPAIDSNGNIYFGSADDKLYSLSPDGSQRWNFTTGGDIDSCPSIDSDGTIYFGSWDNNFYAVGPNGNKEWNYSVNASIIDSSPAIGKNGTVYFGSYDKYIYALDANGNRIWRYNTTEGVISSPAIASDGTVYVGSWSGRLYAFGGAPSAPKNLQAEAGYGKVSLNWDAPEDNGGSAINEYRIYRGTSSTNMGYLRSIEGEVTRYNDTRIISGQQYYYKVSAVNQDSQGPNSSTVNATPMVDEVPPSVTITSPSEGSIVGSSVSVQWTGEDNESGIERYEGRVDDKTWITVRKHTSTTFTDLTNGTHTIYIKAFDYGNNSDQDSVEVEVDTNPPTIKDNTSNLAAPGQDFKFKGEVHDEKMGSVYVKYWTNATNAVNESLSNVGGDIYEYVMIVPSNISYFNYNISAVDSAGNWATVGPINVSVGETNPPRIMDHTDDEAFTGEELTFNVSIEEDTELDKAYVKFWTYSQNRSVNSSMNRIRRMEFRKTITVPNNASELHYMISAKDTSLNWGNTDEKVIPVEDVISPAAVLTEDKTVKVGREVILNAGDSSDNLGISEYSWSFGDGTENNGNESTAIAHKYSSTGTYTVELEVADEAGNKDSTSMEVTVQNQAPPREDSDDDGMPDDWERYYNLDPEEPSDAEMDKDGDGYSNVKEFKGGSDPTDPSSIPKKKEENPLLSFFKDMGMNDYMMLGIIVIAVVIGVIGLIWYRKKKKEKFVPQRPQGYDDRGSRSSRGRYQEESQRQSRPSQRSEGEEGRSRGQQSQQGPKSQKELEEELYKELEEDLFENK